jgi:hypothetical protein
MPQQVVQTFEKVLPITTSDTVALPQYANRYPDAIWCGSSGDIVCVFGDGSTATVGAATGTLVPIAQVMRVNAASTTAAKLLALWQI